MILGIGVDIIEISRIQKAIERWGEGFLNHVFTPEEIAYAQKHKFPYPHFAGRFAAKEAVYKALGDPQAGWKDIIVTNDEKGKPHCRYQADHFQHKILLSL